jgi:hypothetical protein
MTTETRKALRGDRNQCVGCSEYFNSSHAFDKHRTGDHENNLRTCLDTVAMTAKGMFVGSDGFWRGSVMSASLSSSFANSAK